MKKIFITVVASALVSAFLVSFSASILNAKKPEGKSVSKVKEIFTKDYTDEDLLNILANIAVDIKNNNNESLRNEAMELKDYMAYRDNKVIKHDKKYLDTQSPGFYNGERAVEVKYGDWPNSYVMILPLTIKAKPLSAELDKNKIIFSSFMENEIRSAEVKYVRYDSGNKRFENNLGKLLSSLNAVDMSAIRDNIVNVYDDIIIDHESRISLVSKIRDNLAVAKLLLENNQFKAAQNTIASTDSLMIRLIEAKSDSFSEQQKIKKLRRDLDSANKLSNPKYLSQWEAIEPEMSDWWSER